MGEILETAMERPSTAPVTDDGDFQRRHPVVCHAQHVEGVEKLRTSSRGQENNKKSTGNSRQEKPIRKTGCGNQQDPRSGRVAAKILRGT